MKSQNKIKITSKRNIKPKTKAKLVSSAISLICKETSKLRHFKIVEHKHTGKLIHHKHTSHLSLAVMLAMVGMFMYTNNNIAKAETVSGSVSIGVVVTGPPPTVGAVITSPVDGSKLIDVKTIEVVGTCAADTFVVVKNTGIVVGSTMCSSLGSFNITIQSNMGANILSVINYDNYNQPGPETVAITVSNVLKSTDIAVPVIPKNPVTPDNPSIIPGLPLEPTSCIDYKAGELPVSDEPHVSVVCIPRIFGPGISQVMGLLVWGGKSPYAVSVNWGDDATENTLISIAAPGYTTIPFRYTVSKVYKIALKLKDNAGSESITQTAVQVSGSITTPVQSNSVDKTSGAWVIQPVPMYMLAVSITFGFWVGDIFDQKFGYRAPKYNKRTKKSA